MEKVNSNDISFSVKLTHELGDNEIVELSDLYNKVFKNYIKTLRNHEDFMKKFTSNTKKYSFHGLMKKNNKVIGSYSVIPNKFRYFDKDLFFGLGIDTMIDQNYRGNLDNLLKLNNIVYDKLKKDKIYFVFGIADKTYYKIIKKILLYEDICVLNYFTKPIKVKKKNIFIPLFNLILSLYNFIINIITLKQNSTIIKKNIFQIRLDTEQKNFENFNNVKIADNGKFKFAYKLIIESKFDTNIRVLYIFEIYPMSKKNISEVVNYCTKNFDDIELIAYVHNGTEKSLNLLKVPNFFLKNKTIVSGKILENTIIDKNIFDSRNWNLNLSNFEIK